MAFPTSSSATITQISASLTSHVVNLPASITAGQLLIAVVSVRNLGSWTPPSGWTERASQDSGGVGELTLFTKIADGSEGSTVTFTSSIATTGAWHVRKISDWYGTLPTTVTDWVAKSTNGGGSASTTNPPSLSPAWGSADNLFIEIGQLSAEDRNYTGASTDYTDFTTTNASSGGARATVCSAIRQLTASSDDPSTFTQNNTARYWDSMTIAIRPADASAPTVNSNFLAFM